MEQVDNELRDNINKVRSHISEYINDFICDDSAEVEEALTMFSENGNTVNTNIIEWTGDELKGKSKDEQDFIQTIRSHIQKIYNEYQILSLKILHDLSEQSTNDNELKQNLETVASNEMTTLLLKSFIKCVNCGISESSNSFNNYITDEYTELYNVYHNRIQLLESKIQKLTKENETLKKDKKSFFSFNKK